ncbi:MAG: hypothetical protein K2H36_02825 [Clostridia bacterium]|nr:hypothetical protein [Clostridia bacterium]
MVWICVGIAAAAVVLASIIVFALYRFGLLSAYHPMKKAKDDQIKIACVGDSITYGCMVKNWRKNNYPTVLGKTLGDEYCVNNFGYTNRTAIKSADFPLVNEKVYKQSLDFAPNIVFILLGTNDSKANNWDKDKFIKDYGEIIDSYLQLKSSPKLYMIIPPPVFEVGGKVLYKLRKDVIENDICPAVEFIANSKGIELIDMRELFDGRKELFADGVHPNAQGCKIFAKKIFDVLRHNTI